MRAHDTHISLARITFYLTACVISRMDAIPRYQRQHEIFNEHLCGGRRKIFVLLTRKHFQSKTHGLLISTWRDMAENSRAGKRNSIIAALIFSAIPTGRIVEERKKGLKKTNEVLSHIEEEGIREGQKGEQRALVLDDDVTD